MSRNTTGCSGTQQVAHPAHTLHCTPDSSLYDDAIIAVPWVTRGPGFSGTKQVTHPAHTLHCTPDSTLYAWRCLYFYEACSLAG